MIKSFAINLFRNPFGVAWAVGKWILGAMVLLWVFGYAAGIVGTLIGPFVLVFKIALALTITAVIAGVLHKFEITEKPLAKKLLDRLPPKIKESLMSGLSRFTNVDDYRNRRNSRQASQFLDHTSVISALNAKVIGQGEVTHQVVMTIRNRLAKEISQRPLGIFLFVGPPGTGKTYLAKVLAKALSRHYHFENMTQCTNEGSLWKLFGVPAGYSGAGPHGSITGAVKNNKTAVVLLDEVEKAANAVRQGFLVPLDQGFMNDNGYPNTPIDCTKSIWIMTSNAGQERIAALANQNLEADEYRAAAMNILKEENFSPELLSRIDEIFVFRPVVGEQLGEVIGCQIEEILGEFGYKLKDQGIDAETLYQAEEIAELLQKSGGLRAVRGRLEKIIAPQIVDLKQHHPGRTVSITLDFDEKLEKLKVHLED